MSLKQLIVLALVAVAVFFGYKEYTGKSLADTIANKTKSVVDDTKNATMRVAEKRKVGLEGSLEVMEK